MDRQVLRENNNFESPNTSLKNQLNISAVTDVDDKTKSNQDTTKENYNPKPLSEIAADLAPRASLPLSNINTNTSTPKLAKKQESSDFESDLSIDITPNYRRDLLVQPVKDSSLSFLTSGFKQLGLSGSESLEARANLTVSDDEEQFLECVQSFTDLSNRGNNSVKEVSDDSEGNKTVITGNVTIEPEVAQNLTQLLVNDRTFDAAEESEADLTPKTASSGGIFENEEVEVKQEIVEEIKLEDPEISIEKEADPEIVDHEPEIIEEKSEELENEAEKPEISSFVQKVEVSDPEVNSSQEINQEQPEMQDQAPEIIPIIPESQGNSLKIQPEPEVEPKDVSRLSQSQFSGSISFSDSPQDFPDTFSQLPEFKLPESSENHQENKSELTFNDLSAANQQFPLSDYQFKSPGNQFPLTSPKLKSEDPEPMEISFEITQAKKSPAPAEISYRNIDESRHQNFESPAAKQKSFTDRVESSFDVQFKMPAAPVFFKPEVTETPQNYQFSDSDFTSSSSFKFEASDFDYLQNLKSSRNSLPRDSVLLKFDPLLSKPATQRLAATVEEDDFVSELVLKTEIVQEEQTPQLVPFDDDMSTASVERMKDLSNGENQTTLETNHSEENGKFSEHINHNISEKMAELENKLKKEADMREEALLKRISEKEKQISKMNGVVEAYEKAISELIAEKEQIVQSYEKKCSELKNDAELNANHLASLEATFSDLHSKYERAKSIANELNEREKIIQSDRDALKESLKNQENRYDRMKAHAIAQLEFANSTLAERDRSQSAEVTKLKALLKKEEISRASINEQLIQKTKENSELVKICDELINAGTNSS